MAYKHDDKSSGQLIRSADWNAMGHEIERLETDKVNRAGDTIKGDLTVTGKAQLGSLAVTGDASITGNVQFGSLAVTGDASITGKAQLGSLTVTGDAGITGKVLGPLTVSGDASITGKAQFGSLAVTGNASVSGNLGIGTTDIPGNSRLAIIGGAITIGSSPYRADAAIHISSSFGGFDRLLQMSPTGPSKPGLNLLASHSAAGNEQWWAWGVTTDYKWRIQPGTAFDGAGGLTIDSSGNVGIGTYNPRTKLEVAGAVTLGNSDIYFSKTDHDHTGIGNTDGWAAIENAKNYDALMILGRAHAGGKRIVKLWDYLEVNGDSVVNGTFYVNSPSGNRLIMQSDGNLVIYRSNGAAWWNSGTNVSDSRLKRNIRFIERPLEKLLSINGISFSWVEKEWGSERELGVLADEIEKVFPELVCSLDKKYKSVKYQGLIAVLIEAIKEQQATIQQFGEEIQNLKGMLKLNPA